MSGIAAIVLAILIVGALGRAAWGLATFLVVPVLVVERVSPPVLAVAPVVMVTAALDTIFRAAAYRYATVETIQDHAATDAIPAAFRVKG